MEIKLSDIVNRLKSEIGELYYIIAARDIEILQLKEELENRNKTERQ